MHCYSRAYTRSKMGKKSFISRNFESDGQKVPDKSWIFIEIIYFRNWERCQRTSFLMCWISIFLAILLIFVHLQFHKKKHCFLVGCVCLSVCPTGLQVLWSLFSFFLSAFPLNFTWSISVTQCSQENDKQPKISSDFSVCKLIIMPR